MKASEEPKNISVLSLALPASAVFLMSTVAGAITIKIVSELGISEVAAVTAGQRINFFAFAILMGMGAATVALVSRAWGAGTKDKVISATKLSMKIGMFISVMMSIASIAMARPLANFFNLEGESLELSVEYIRWLSLFGPFQCIVLILSTASRAVGDARTPLVFGLISNSLGVLGAYLLAFGKFGLPAMGVVGAAVGWGIAFGATALIFLLFWMSDRLSLPYKWADEPYKVSVNRFMGICLPSIVEQMIIQGAMILFIGFAGTYGEKVFAAYGVGMNLFLLTIVLGVGFSMASSTLVGHALGAKNKELALKQANEALKMAFISMITTGTLSAIFAHELASLMVSDPETAELTAQFIIALAFVQPMLAIDFVLAGAMRGAGHTGFPLFAGLVTILGVRLPLAALVTELGLPVVWMFSIFVVDQFIKVIMVVWRYRQERWLR